MKKASPRVDLRANPLPRDRWRPCNQPLLFSGVFRTNRKCGFVVFSGFRLDWCNALAIATYANILFLYRNERSRNTFFSFPLSGLTLFGVLTKKNSEKSKAAIFVLLFRFRSPSEPIPTFSLLFVRLKLLEHINKTLPRVVRLGIVFFQMEPPPSANKEEYCQQVLLHLSPQYCYLTITNFRSHIRRLSYQSLDLNLRRWTNFSGWFIVTSFLSMAKSYIMLACLSLN